LASIGCSGAEPDLAHIGIGDGDDGSGVEWRAAIGLFGKPGGGELIIAGVKIADAQFAIGAGGT
jgi:hypothetical protein